MFYLQDSIDDSTTPRSQVASSSKSKLRYADIVPYDDEENDVVHDNNESDKTTPGTKSSEKRTFVDLEKDDDELNKTTPGTNSSEKRTFVDLEKDDEELNEKAKGKRPMFSTDLAKE